MKILAPGGVGTVQFIRTTARCPHCGKEAVLEPIGQHDLSLSGGYVCGQRRCPNAQCHGHIFVAFHNNELSASYPPIRIDFDPQNIPSQVLSTLEEAITCHANSCFVASAIMVRRTLEEVCAERQAEGKNLKQRLESLQTKIVIPKELIEAMDDLRMLGNDAAHIEAKEYDNISDEEVTVALEVTKEILKSLYQYSALLGKMRALKKDKDA